MATGSTERHGTPVKPLLGSRIWIISDGKAGHEAMCLGVAEALGGTVTWKHVTPRGLYRAFAPWAPVARRERFGRGESAFAPPWPQIALAAGRTTIPYIRALKRRAGARTFTVILLDPKTGPNTADLFWVPEHDQRRGPNVITTLTSPHRFSPARLDELRREPPADIERLPRPRVAVLLGGPNGDYRYTEDALARLSQSVSSLARTGVGLMITPSRRTPPELVTAVDEATRAAPRVLWRGEADNPYAHFLAAADAFIVTADSVNMTGEAAGTGRPIFIFEPDGGAKKFRAFHEALRARGITRALPETFERLVPWTYTPMDSASVIAGEIERRWQRRREMLGGLVAESWREK